LDVTAASGLSDGDGYGYGGGGMGGGRLSEHEQASEGRRRVRNIGLEEEPPSVVLVAGHSLVPIERVRFRTRDRSLTAVVAGKRTVRPVKKSTTTTRPRQPASQLARAGRLGGGRRKRVAGCSRTVNFAPAAIVARSTLE